MASRLKIKIGTVEFEYEGDTGFDIATIQELLTHLQSVVTTLPARAISAPFSATDEQFGGRASAGDGDLANLSANTVAARLEVKTGTDMAVAAAAYLQLCQNKETFTRKDLLDTMQSAKTYYKTSMGSNLTKSIDTLIAGKRINSLNNNEMSLSAAELTSVKARLAN